MKYNIQSYVSDGTIVLLNERYLVKFKIESGLHVAWSMNLQDPLDRSHSNEDLVPKESTFGYVDCVNTQAFQFGNET